MLIDINYENPDKTAELLKQIELKKRELDALLYEFHCALALKMKIKEQPLK